MLARLDAQLAEQRRFAANASHELRTPLAITQTLLDVARNDPNRDAADSSTTPCRQRPSDRPHRGACSCSAAPTSDRSRENRSTCRSSRRKPPKRSCPLAEKHGVTIQTSGDITPTVGSHALLLQMTTNLVHNAIVHNLPEHGTVQVTTAIRAESVVLTVENTGERAHATAGLDAHRTVPARHRTPTQTMQASASAWPSSRASPRHTTERSPSSLAPIGGICVTARLPAGPA